MKKPIFILTIFNMLILACKEEYITNNPIPQGNIMGFVSLYDEYNETIKNNSNVQISLVHTEFTTLTDSAGKWTLHDIPQGIYNIKFFKEGFAEYIRQGFQFVGNGTASIITHLGELPTFPINDLTAQTFLDYLEVEITVPDTAVSRSFRYIRYFVGPNSNVAANTTNYSFEDLIMIPQFQSYYKFQIHSNWFDDFEFISGDSAYLIVYPATPGFPISYRDLETGIYIYTNLGTNYSEVIEITVP